MRWDADAQVFVDSETGEPLTDQQVVDIRDGYADQVADQLEALVNDYADGTSEREQFERDFLRMLTESATSSYVLGRGGVEAMDDADYDDLATLIAEQEGYARQFFADIEAELGRGEQEARNGG